MFRITEQTGVVLDLDDTLYSERDFQLSGFRRVARLVAPQNADELLASMLAEETSGGNPLGLAARVGHSSVANLLNVYRTHIPDITLYSDARRLLERCAAIGIRPVLVTDGRSVTQRNRIEALGLDEYIAGAVISEEFGAGKPCPKVFVAAQALVPATGHFYIADNPAKDFIGPNELGWATVMLRDRGRNVHPQAISTEHSCQADEVVDSLDQIRVG